MRLLILTIICIVSTSFISCSLLKKSYSTKKDNSGLYPIQDGGKLGYIDRNGKVVINPQFDWAGEFSEGLANVGIGGKSAVYF